MSFEYRYASRDSDVLTIMPPISHDRVFVSIAEDGTGGAMHIAKADVPTVAAELLKAAGQESVIVAKSDDEVREVRYGWLEAGDEMGFVEAHESWSPADIRTRAANYIALAGYIENKAQREAEAEKKLQGRRNALSFQLTGEGETGPRIPYAARTAPLRQAIDRIIELEDGK